MVSLRSVKVPDFRLLYGCPRRPLRRRLVEMLGERPLQVSCGR